MSVGLSPMVVVAGCHVIEIRVDRSGSPRSMIVSVELDYERSWLFDEPGWQDLAVGVTGNVAYLWSARHLVVLPAGARQGDPLVITADEDIRLAFAVARGWLLVCETSVRYFTEGELASRLEFGEVLLAGRWEGPQLVIRDAAGQDIKVVLSGGAWSLADGGQRLAAGLGRLPGSFLCQLMPPARVFCPRVPGLRE